MLNYTPALGFYQALPLLGAGVSSLPELSMFNVGFLFGTAPAGDMRPSSGNRSLIRASIWGQMTLEVGPETVTSRRWLSL